MPPLMPTQLLNARVSWRPISRSRFGMWGCSASQKLVDLVAWKPNSKCVGGSKKFWDRNLGESSDFRSRNGRCISHKNRPLAVAKSSSKAIELWNTSINTMFWGDLHPALPSYFDAPGFLTQPFPLQSHWMTILGRWNPTKSPFLVAGKSRWENGEIPWKIPRCLTHFSRYPVLSLPADSSIESRQRFGLQHLPQSRGPLQHGKDLGSSEVHINNGRRMEWQQEVGEVGGISPKMVSL